MFGKKKFKRLNLQGVKSISAGFIVQIEDRFEMSYRDGNHKMKISIDPGVNLGVSVESMKKWLPPHDNEEISAMELAKIKSNVREALDFLKIESEFY